MPNMCSTESVLRRAVIKYLNPTFSAKYFRRDNVLAIVTLSPVAVEFQPACSLAMNVLPPAPALPRRSSVTHSDIRTSFVCTVRAALAVVHQHSLLNADSLFLTVQRTQNKPNTIIVRKREQCPMLSGFGNFTQHKGAIFRAVTYVHSFTGLQVVLLQAPPFCLVAMEL
ncbi:hypothetical protein HPB49_020366 [Dermacentor silvarum]|uniref:Uncharacterized protein n=1 Tax=Dermacentor silvarum TaxID=543639 RepID=A0ACB8DFZ3_DERSI|nr:hypothetical protein HPB49_020366 [Dermacentor silvarum]